MPRGLNRLLLTVLVLDQCVKDISDNIVFNLLKASSCLRPHTNFSFIPPDRQENVVLDIVPSSSLFRTVSLGFRC